MKKAWKQFLSLLLVLCLLTPLCGAASAAEGEEVQDTGYVGVFDYTGTNMNLTLEDRTTTLKFYVENYQTKERLDLDSYEALIYTYPFNNTFASIQKTERLEDENSYLITVYAENNTNEVEGPTIVEVNVTLHEGVGVCVREDGTPSSGTYESKGFSVTGFPVYEIGLRLDEGITQSDPSSTIYSCTMKVGEKRQLHVYVTRNGEEVSEPDVNIEREAAPQTPQIRVDDTGLLEAISATPENIPMDTLRFEYIPPESQSLRVWGRLIVLVEEGEPTTDPDDDDKPGTGGSGSSGGSSGSGSSGGSALPPTGTGSGTGTDTGATPDPDGGASAPNRQPQGCVSDTVGNFNIFGAYQYKLTPTNGQTPAVTVSNSNFRVVLAGQEDGSYYYKVYSVGAPGTTCDVYVNGTKVSTVTAAEPYGGVESDTTAPFTVKEGGTYQFMFTAEARPTVAAGSASFRVEFTRNEGNHWYFTATAEGNPGEGCGFYVNGAPFAIAVAHIAA